MKGNPCRPGDLAQVIPPMHNTPEMEGRYVIVKREALLSEYDTDEGIELTWIVYSPGKRLPVIGAGIFGNLAKRFDRNRPIADANLKPIRPDAEPESIEREKELAE